MRLFTKLGSRLAVLVIIYMLLSIPKARFMAREDLHPVIRPASESGWFGAATTGLEGLSADSLRSLYRTGSRHISEEIARLQSEMLPPGAQDIPDLNKALAVAALAAILGEEDPLPLYRLIWQWRHYLKEQSLFWNLDTDSNRQALNTALYQLSQLEDFLAINRGLQIGLTADSLLPVTRLPTDWLQSGDFLVSDIPLLYPYTGLAKQPPALLSGAGLVLLQHDTSLYLASHPPGGLGNLPLPDYRQQAAGKILVLRWHPDLPGIIANPTLAHQAARYAGELTASLPLPYDYLLEAGNHSALYETELIGYVYEGRKVNIRKPYLPVDSSFLRPLNRLGIHNEDQASAEELLYHPGLELVALQINGPLLRDHYLYLAATRAAMTGLNDRSSRKIRWLLPWYRLLGFYDAAGSLLNLAPVLPENMPPETALVHDYLQTRVAEMLPLLEKEVSRFETGQGYFPAFDELFGLALKVAGQPATP